MKQITLRFYEERRPSFAVSITLDERWLKKPAQKLIKHFFGAYATALAQKAPSSRLYSIIDTATGANISDIVLSEYNFDDGAVFSIVRLETSKPTSATPIPSHADEREVRMQRNPNYHNNEEFNLMYDAYSLHLFENRYRNAKELKYMHSKKRLQEILIRRNAQSETDGDSDSFSRPPTVTESDCNSSCFDEFEEEPSEKIAAPTSSTTAVRGPKDWNRINYKKSMCPHVVAGRACPVGVDCTYAHSSMELRDRPRANVTTETTADIELPKPELWQLGVFADEARRQPFLWSRMTKRQQSNKNVDLPYGNMFIFLVRGPSQNNTLLHCSSSWLFLHLTIVVQFFYMNMKKKSG